MRRYSIEKYLRKLGIRKREQPLPPLDVEALRAAFQTRYHNFKLLLGANNKALQIMSELSEARNGRTPFGMSFVRANNAALSVNVLRMIQSMEQLAPGKYPGLDDSFRSVEGRIAEIMLAAKKETGTGRRVIPLSDLDKTKSDEAGNKLANLGEIHNRLGIKVPNGFVISSRAFREFVGQDLQIEIDRLMQSSPTEDMEQLFALSARIQQQILRADVPAELEQAVLSAYGELERTEGRGVRVSLRSSALGEDARHGSFAGLYRSELNVSADNLIAAYKDVVASKYSLQAIAYRLSRGIPDDDIDMCVGCMSMVNATAGGVMYSRNPLDARDGRILIHSAFGLPKAVVDGSVAADLFVVARSPLRVEERRVAEKEQKFVCYPEEGVCRLEVPANERSLPSISEQTALELASIALRIEDHYGLAQDVEWALTENGDIVVLQCRPLGQQSTFADLERRSSEIPACDVIASGGLTASPGAGYGPVSVVRKDSEVLSFPEGAVLVVKQALPRWAALLGRASALIAEQGSAAGHLANVAREFGVPAILGLGGITELLDNGRPVTVDADGLRVCNGKIDALLEDRGKSRSLMEDSPVLGVLNRVCEHITPLHLLDPEGLDFKPSSCRTFHDITRFCHEKAVIEMFSFGKDHHFSEKAAKQLVCRIPMQWWVLNLDDAFRVDVPGKLVSLDNIVSIPMLALWEGIIAVPWGGPPPVDAGGLMSILMEAATNPALDPALPSPYTGRWDGRNYFMISKNFCSLSSRFGFHYSTVEALVSERASENYVSFAFKGGAADYDRRVRRARFVGAILEQFDFRCEVRDDGVMARAEGYDEEEMQKKLKVLGYLTIHTRQLDVIMHNDAFCEQLRGKMLADISSVVLSQPSRNTALH